LRAQVLRLARGQVLGAGEAGAVAGGGVEARSIARAEPAVLSVLWKNGSASAADADPSSRMTARAALRGMTARAALRRGIRLRAMAGPPLACQDE
jgi:hypothetical protein